MISVERAESRLIYNNIMATEAERFAASASETVQMLANEPSMGLYYVMEHVQRSVPTLAADKAQLRKAAEAARGIETDARFALDELDSAVSGAAQSALANTLRLAKSSAARLEQKPA